MLREGERETTNRLYIFHRRKIEMERWREEEERVIVIMKLKFWNACIDGDFWMK